MNAVRSYLEARERRRKECKKQEEWARSYYGKPDLGYISEPLYPDPNDETVFTGWDRITGVAEAESHVIGWKEETIDNGVDWGYYEVPVFDEEYSHRLFLVWVFQFVGALAVISLIGLTYWLSRDLNSWGWLTGPLTWILFMVLITRRYPPGEDEIREHRRRLRRRNI